MRNLVLGNQLLYGTVNAGAPAFDQAIADLGKFNARWPKEVRALITGRFPPENIGDVLSGGKDAIKAVIQFNKLSSAKGEKGGNGDTWRGARWSKKQVGRHNPPLQEPTSREQPVDRKARVARPPRRKSWGRPRAHGPRRPPPPRVRACGGGGPPPGGRAASLP